MNIITISDLHGRMNENQLISELDDKISDADMILFLGDITYPELEVIVEYAGNLKYEIPLYGVLGNHDQKNLFDDLPEIKKDGFYFTEDRNKECYSLCSLSGSLKYKDSDYYSLLTQDECLDIMDKYPECDIFICHDKPNFDESAYYTSGSSNPHLGLYGIGKYIDEKKPMYVFHGHIHERYVLERGHTKIYSCYGVEKHTIKL